MPDKAFDTAISERVRIELAKRPEIRQVHIARAIGMGQQSLNNRINGSIPFEAAILAKVAAYLNVPVADLLPTTDQAAS
jgi:transcriptional regulator with XRE-family HTH domain